MSRAVVVGGGLAGAMAALTLARRGDEVTLYERHGDLRREVVPGPSMNLGLSRRGLEALAAVGLAEEVLARSIPMLGRVVHRLDRGAVHQPYGGRAGQVIHAIKRGDINALLLDRLEGEGVGLHFRHRAVGLDREAPAVTFATGAATEDERRVRVEADLVVGADGVFSVVRREMQRGLPAEYRQEFLDWGWKELTIPPPAGGRWALEKNAFHLWPRGGSMLFAHPNLDGSFTCSFVLPHEGETSFASLADPDRIGALFADRYPDLPPLVPDLVEQFARNPVVDLVSVRTRPWSWRGRVVLVGDAAHAVVPFMAQGMNAAFEDCRLLVDHLDRHRDRTVALTAFEAARKPHTDALAEMSKANFVELRDRVRSPWLRAKKGLDTLLSRYLGERWMPLHARVTHTSEPYAAARLRCQQQDRLLAAAAAVPVVVAVALAVARRAAKRPAATVRRPGRRARPGPRLTAAPTPAAVGRASS